MKLIGTVCNTFTRKTRIVLIEKKIDFEFICLEESALPASILHCNPLGRIPVLVLDDQSTLFDSRVIVEYLDATTPNNKLLPAHPRERMETRRLETLCEGLSSAVLQMKRETKKSVPQQNVEWLSFQKGIVTRTLDHLEKVLADRNSLWLGGVRPSLADIATGCAWDDVCFNLPGTVNPHEYPSLEKFSAQVNERPSFRNTAPVSYPQ